MDGSNSLHAVPHGPGSPRAPASKRLRECQREIVDMTTDDVFVIHEPLNMVTKQPYQCFDIDCDCVGWHASCKFDDGRTFCWHGEMFPVEYVAAQKWYIGFNSEVFLMDADTFVSVFKYLFGHLPWEKPRKAIEEVFECCHVRHD